jgi:hypothetical protein
MAGLGLINRRRANQSSPTLEEYTPLLYIELNGQQVIPTDYYWNPLTTIRMECMLAENGNTNAAGKNNNILYSANGNYLFAIKHGDGATEFNTLFWWCPKTYAAGGVLNFRNFSNIKDVRLEISSNLGSKYWLEINTPSGLVGYDASGNMPVTALEQFYIGGRPSAPYNRSNLRLYRLQFMENNEVVRDYIPAALKGRNGVYELITETFYTSLDNSDVNGVTE